MSENTPVLPGFIQDHDSGQQTLRVWCRWCCIWHEHGYTGTAIGDTTHRGAHCNAPDSKYSETDYWIRVSGTPFPTVQKSIRTATVAQRQAIRDGRISDAVQQLRDQEPPVG